MAETYAFLPREAVTKFLMSCADCQKRMHLTMDSCGTVQTRLPDTVSVVHPFTPADKHPMNRLLSGVIGGEYLDNMDYREDSHSLNSATSIIMLRHTK